MTETTTSTFTADAIAAGLSTYPHPKPVLYTGALAEAIRVQLRTWVTAELGFTVPAPKTLTDKPADSIARLLGEITAHVNHFGVLQASGDAEPWGLAHLFHAHADTLYAANGRGDAYLLGALYSLIAARAHLRDGHQGRIELTPFGGHQPAVDESALIETARVQLTTWVPDTFGTVQLPERWELHDAADLSDVLADVIGAAEAKYGDMDDDNSICGMAHLANARAHGLKAGHGHGDAHLFAALNSLVLAAASLA